MTDTRTNEPVNTGSQAQTSPVTELRLGVGAPGSASNPIQPRPSMEEPWAIRMREKGIIPK